METIEERRLEGAIYELTSSIKELTAKLPNLEESPKRIIRNDLPFSDSTPLSQLGMHLSPTLRKIFNYARVETVRDLLSKSPSDVRKLPIGIKSCLEYSDFVHELLLKIFNDSSVQ